MRKSTLFVPLYMHVIYINLHVGIYRALETLVLYSRYRLVCRINLCMCRHSSPRAIVNCELRQENAPTFHLDLCGLCSRSSQRRYVCFAIIWYSEKPHNLRIDGFFSFSAFSRNCLRLTTDTLTRCHKNFIRIFVRLLFWRAVAPTH